MTNLDYALDLPDPIFKRFMRVAVPSRLSSPASSLAEAIEDSFTWERSIEGQDFWDAVHEYALAGKFPIPKVRSMELGEYEDTEATAIDFNPTVFFRNGKVYTKPFSKNSKP